MSQTLLLLGGSRYLFPVIDAAHEMGVEVVTADYLPGNVAHARSDRYRDVSIVDREAVLECAREVGADGVMSFAADPGVVSAAYAADRLGLPFQGSFEAVSILQDKQRFRSFLRKNGFSCPEVRVFSSAGEARAAAERIAYPVIAKPVDSAGSKGCSRVDSPEGLGAAVEYALRFSRDGRCIVEGFLENAFPSSDADAFTVDGRFECVSFTSQLFDASCPNPYAPAAYAMPCAMPQAAQDELKAELQRLSDLLGLRSGIYNVETRVATDGRPYIMEVSPRGGGNRLAEMLRFATGGAADLVVASVRAALGMPVGDVVMPSYDGFWHQEILHSDRAGILRGVEYAPGFREAHVTDEQLWVPAGSEVQAFASANFAFGSVMMRFGTREEFEEFEAGKEQFMRVVVE